MLAATPQTDHRISAHHGASLAVHDVFKIYKEHEVQTVALRGANLEVAPGEFVAVVGRSGSGKSTLFSLLAGLTEPTAGRIEIDGRDLSALSEAERARLRRERLGVTFQSGNLLPYLSALENVALPLELAAHPQPRRRAEELLGELGLTGREASMPAQLSGGEQARVALAMALANRPGLLLADEPTGELDTRTAGEIIALIESLNRDQGLTVLLVTHNPELAARADRRVRITDGVLTEETGV
jgi:ABC-type lipoprotein export system ATPase subunit